jgi:hypothetical protein
MGDAGGDRTARPPPKRVNASRIPHPASLDFKWLAEFASVSRRSITR